MPDSRKLVAGRYRLVGQIGSGGMGRVWLARDEVLHRDVAIKEVVLPAGLIDAERDELIERTLREARAAGRLSHPNVIQVYDVVMFEERPWIVMEYVLSRSLYQVIREDGPLPPRRVAEIGLLVLAALRAAHKARVWHRDVKPGNVLLAKDGRVVLTDFGLATFDGDGGVTRSGLILGSAQYISPERARDGESGPESDLWSLGATLYAAVEGRSPYARESSMATLTALATAPPDTPKRAGPLRPVLLGLLRKNPRHRLGAADTEKLLRAVANGEKGKAKLPRQREVAEQPAELPFAGAPPTMVAPGDVARQLVFTPTAGGDNSTATQETHRYPRGGRRRWPWLLAVAVVVIGLIGAGVALVLHRVSPPTAVGPSATASSTPTSALTPAMGVQACLAAPPGSGVQATGTASAPRAPSDAPANWIYYRDSGFHVVVPDVWRVWRLGPLLCLRSPGNDLAAAVISYGQEQGTSAELSDLHEAEWRAAADPADYKRLGELPRTHRDEPATELEYSYAVDGAPMHGANLLVRDGGQVYLLCWVTPAYMWSTQANSRLSFQGSFGLDN